MKAQKGWDGRAGQYKVEVDRKTFYVGTDAAQRDQRKAAIRAYRSTLTGWSPQSIEAAKLIGKGERVQVRAQSDEAAYYARERELVAAGVPVLPAVTTDDLAAAQVSLLRDRIAELEAELRELAGPRVAERSTVTVVEVFNNWHEYRKATATYPGTQTPTDAVKGEGNVVQFILRQLPDPALKLSQFKYAEIDLLCKRIAARPATATKLKKSCSRKWAKECLKIVRRVLKWAVRTYGCSLPAEWVEATNGAVKWTKEDQLSRQRMAELIYSVEELQTLYRSAIPAERVCLLLALNCGFRQREITALHEDEIKGTRIARYRDKSNVYAEWQLWQETIEAMQQSKRPVQRSKVVRAWDRLLDRVQKVDPTFRRLSFKRLCKTGATAIRRIAGGEVASMYVSHGQATSDDLLESYAAADWQRLHTALAAWRLELGFENLRPIVSGRTALPISKIELCKTLWRNGAGDKEIIKQTGLSRATVYRYRVAKELEPTPA